MTAPSRDDATLRGAVVLVVAIVIGLALLARSGGGSDEDTSSKETTESTASTTTVAAGDSTTVPVGGSTTPTTAAITGDTQVPADITVAVINATETVDWAADNASILESAGYVTTKGNPVGDNSDTSIIYSTPEAQADAQAVASLLSLGSAQVDMKPAEALAGNGADADADVVVILGADSVTG
ncbi:MAG TPA: LytR C-terminal domain-containing protein [Iamia sp.]|nr:LytR C-terminal domain-containing protein [Iamia sp.]